MLDELGLASAIEWQSREFIKRTGIKCNLEIEEIENLNGNIAISLFRIFQASITNIMLHSQAKSVNIKLGIVGELLQLSIFADGIGISQEQLNSSKSFGIIGMRERANQINGTFIINTQPNKGTKISVNVDLTKKEESL
jgi:signal transduction histidine kinase